MIQLRRNNRLWYILGMIGGFTSHLFFGARAETARMSIKHTSAYEHYYEQIQKQFSTGQLLEHVTFHADIHMQPEEFFYLTELKVGSVIGADDVARAVAYLFKKKVIEEISITSTPGAHGICVHVDIHGYTVLGRVKIRGFFTDKQQYVQCYVIDRGDRFEMEYHDRSVEKMRDLCKGEGCFNASLVSTFTYDDRVKVINPTIAIDKGPRFTVARARISVRDGHVHTAEDGEQLFLEKKIYTLFLKKLVKKPYDKEFLNRCASDIKEYLACKGFVDATMVLDEHIDTRTKAVDLHWRLELHHKCSFVFWGNRFFSQNQLHHYMRAFGKSAWLLPSSLVAHEIERIYRDKGFDEISIEVQEEKNRSFFIIKEGRRALVKAVEIVSAAALSSSSIVKHCFAAFSRGTYFDKELLEHSFASVCSLYEKSGFLDARVMGYELVNKEGDLNGCILRVTIDEGEATRCVGVEVPDMPEIVTQEPFARVAKAREYRGVIFNAQLIQEQRLSLQNYMRDRLLRSIRIEPEIRVESSHEVVVVWHVDYDKTPVRFGKTVIQGCCTYPFERLMRELPYERGQLWRADALKKTFLHLKKRAVFDTIHVLADHKMRINQEKAFPGERTVLIRLQNDDPFELRVRAGLGFQHVQNYQTFGGLTYKLGGSFIVKNSTNRADLLSTHVDFARSHRELVVKYSLPWLLHMPFDGLLQGYSTQYIQPGFIGSNSNIYTVTQHGLLAGIHKKTSHFEGEIHVGLEGMRIAIDSRDRELFTAGVARAINFEPRLQNKMVPFLYVEPTMYIDFLDDGLNPTRGTYSLLSLKGMLPLAASYERSCFAKLLLEHAFFLPAGRSVIALRARFGHIFYQQFSAIMPTERFYLGGSHSLRGYDADMAPPLGAFIDAQGKKQVVPRGGKTMLNGNIELRIPFMQGVGGVLFQDIGLLSSDVRVDLGKENMVVATGFGLRIGTPVGPLRFDMGFNWRQSDICMPRFAWFLTFGHAF